MLTFRIPLLVGLLVLFSGITDGRRSTGRVCQDAKLFAIFSEARTPECDAAGLFRRKQCDYSGPEKLCWCVDPTVGEEMPGTKHVVQALGDEPDCDYYTFGGKTDLLSGLRSGELDGISMTDGFFRGPPAFFFNYTDSDYTSFLQTNAIYELAEEYLPHRMWPEFSIKATLDYRSPHSSYLFTVTDRYESIILLGLRLRQGDDSRTQYLQIVYSGQEADETRIIAEFTIPSIQKQWQRIAVSVNQTLATLYVNCHQYTSTPLSEPLPRLTLPDGAMLLLGHGGKFYEDAFKGSLQELMITGQASDARDQCKVDPTESLEGSGTEDTDNGPDDESEEEFAPKKGMNVGVVGNSPPLSLKPDGFLDSNSQEAVLPTEKTPGSDSMKMTFDETLPDDEDFSEHGSGIKLTTIAAEEPIFFTKDVETSLTPLVVTASPSEGSSGAVRVGKGEKGDVGPIGYPGETGRKGDPGESGLGSWLFTEGSGDFDSTDPRMFELRDQLLQVGLKGEPGTCDTDCKALQGPPGKDGKSGSKGIAGAHGTPGIRGPKGDTGDDGAVGVKGEPGDMGSVGMTGHKGDVGSKGEVGEIGPLGPVGPSGAPGEVIHFKGEAVAGQAGLPGPAGQKGETGTSGRHGDKGSQGEKGEMGMKGELGTKGTPGADGTHGSKGERGDQGSAGADGAAGSDGLPGLNGVDGMAGPKGATGLGVPGRTGLKGEPGQGVESLTDTHIDKLAKRLKGEAGTPGRDGSKGARGRVGPPGITPAAVGDLIRLQKSSYGKGDKGDAGAPGSCGSCNGVESTNMLPGGGAVGPKGNSGIQGPPGVPGPRGPSGQDGFPGLDGLKGEPGMSRRGEKGEPGLGANTDSIREVVEEVANGLIVGKKGDPGRDGIKGQAGIPGVLGFPGPAGPRGKRGKNGFGGPIGIKGEKGDPGSGLSIDGKSVAVGPPGPPGRPGESIVGQKGAQGPPGSGTQTGTILYTSQRELVEAGITVSPGTLAFVTDSQRLFVRVESAWRVVSLGPAVPVFNGGVDFGNSIPLSNSVVLEAKAPTSLQAAAPSRPGLRLIALNDALHGDTGGIGGADFLCWKQAKTFGLKGSFRAVLASGFQDLGVLVHRESRFNYPVVNMKGEVIAPSWSSLVTERGALNDDVSLYSFDGHNVMQDHSRWPNKVFWHGATELGKVDSRNSCGGWSERGRSRYGKATSLVSRSFLADTRYSCQNRFVVLCIEASAIEL